ncbi:hypothetical protein [uncultured Treponema sp.]|jgi:hypothetical protein|uniref:hypothetical protein n=1 Tax=uncultured Treponema sp. TaxID=162155 RepID=UPI00280B214E|nr:hypothetical protein [uncultured Treponema sp.]
MSFILVVSAVIVVFIIIKKKKNKSIKEEIYPQEELEPLSWLQETANQPRETTNKSKATSKKTKQDYEERLKNALSEIPLPAAYREAAVALRGLRRTYSENAERYIKQLYDLAVKNSLSIDYSDFCEYPGYNILETIPEAVISSLEYTYNEIGYEKLSLLTATDIKAVTGLWGEPKSHKTLNEKYHKLWHDYELKYKRENPF